MTDQLQHFKGLEEWWGLVSVAVSGSNLSEI
jgi:hypothetical protein